MSHSVGSGWKRRGMDPARTLPADNNEPFYHEAMTEKGGKAGVRKYLLLLQDSIAIKFVREKDGGGGSNEKATGGMDESGRRRLSHPNPSFQQHCPSPCCAWNCSTKGGSAVPYQGFFLFQNFREVNLQCYWNSSILLAFQKLEYAGFISPSTIFVSALRKFLHVLRSGWARQLIRSPPGYAIEFMGDVEELICEPIQQSYFSPLSDSLCWAITDLSSRGEEAFVDRICGDLEESFPWMVQPNPTLVYKMLDKLTQENKIYRTSRGYFIVTPDTLRYMTQRLGHPSRREHQNPGHSCSTSTLPRRPSGCSTNQDQEQLLRSVGQNDSLRRDSMTLGQEAEDEDQLLVASATAHVQPPSRLTRHNSLKIFSRRESFPAKKRALSGARSFSFRLSRGKSLNLSEYSSEGEPSYSANTGFQTASAQTESPAVTKKGAKEGFLRKLFGLRRSKKQEGRSKDGKKKKENKLKDDGGDTDSRHEESYASQYDYLVNDKLLRRDDLILADMIALDSRTKCGNECELMAAPVSSLGSNRRWNSLPKRSQRTAGGGSSRRSVLAMMEDNNVGSLYATASDVTGGGLNRAQSSRSSTLSQGTSLGYGSQGPQSLATNSQSPCPSLNGTYASLNHPNSRNGTMKKERPKADALKSQGKDRTVSDNSNGTVSSSSCSTPRASADVYRANTKEAFYVNNLSRRCSSPVIPVTSWRDTTSKPLYETIRDDRAKRASISGCVDNKKLASALTNNTTTTTITQSVQSRNNLSIELSLENKNSPRGTDDDGGSINLSIGDTQIRLAKPGPPSNNNSPTEVKTSVNDAGQVETSIDSSQGILMSKIKLKYPGQSVVSNNSCESDNSGSRRSSSSSSSATNKVTLLPSAILTS